LVAGQEISFLGLPSGADLDVPGAAADQYNHAVYLLLARQLLKPLLEIPVAILAAFDFFPVFFRDRGECLDNQVLAVLVVDLTKDFIRFFDRLALEEWRPGIVLDCGRRGVGRAGSDKAADKDGRDEKPAKGRGHGG